MEGKSEVSMADAFRLLHPRNTVLLTCTGKDSKPNVLTLTWATPTSHSPPLVAVSISPKRYSHRLIEESGEFTINIPTMEIIDKVLKCGRVSGRSVDKFSEAGLTPVPGERVKAPMIRECVAHLECKVVDKVTPGDHTLFVGEVLAGRAVRELFDKDFNVDRFRPVLHIGGDSFVTIRPKVFTPGV